MQKNKIALIVGGVFFSLLILFIVLLVFSFIQGNNFNTTHIAKINGIININEEYKTENQIKIEDYELSHDYDKDGLINEAELKNGTSIYSKDTDNDGLTDFAELNEFNSNPLEASTKKDNIKDGVKVYYGVSPRDSLPSELLNKEETFQNENIGISLTSSDINTRVFNAIETFIPIDINIPIYKGFYLHNVDKGQVSVDTTTEMKEDGYTVFYYDEINDDIIKIPYTESENKIIININQNSKLPIVIATEETASNLTKNNYVIIKSKLPLMKGIQIYNISNGLNKKETISISPSDIGVDKLSYENTGLIKSFLINSFSNFALTNSLDLDVALATIKCNMSRNTLIKYLSQKDTENDFIIGKNTFKINNFSTDLNRQNHSAGLVFIPAYFKDKDIPLEQSYTFEEYRKTTSFDLGRDIKAYNEILNKNFGKYNFQYSIPEKNSVDVIDNPDKQVYKLIEMYNHFFFTNKKQFEFNEMKRYSDFTNVITSQIDNKKYIILGMSNSNGGIFLLGYDYENDTTSSTIKVKVFDPNIFTNKINGKEIDNSVYLTPTTQKIILGENNTQTYSQYNFYYDASKDNNKKYYFDSSTYNLDLFIL